MTSRPGPQLPTLISDELRDVDWHVESGSKHWKIMIGSHMVAVWPRGTVSDINRRSTLMTRSRIRQWKDQHR
jgi:hypothetical protein